MESHKKQILLRDAGRCVYCGRSLLQDQESYLSLTIDHLIPKKENDASHVQTTVHYIHNLENKVLSCRNCNALKGDYIPEGADLSEFPEHREAYLNAIRKKIAAKRAHALQEFLEAVIA